MDSWMAQNVTYQTANDDDGGQYDVTSNVSSLATNNVSNGSAAVDLRKPDYIVILVTLFYSVIFLLGVVGNVMVILVVCRNKSMRSSTNVFLVSLTIADLSVILVCMPAALLEFSSDDIWHLGNVMCKCSAAAFCLLLLFCSLTRGCDNAAVTCNWVTSGVMFSVVTFLFLMEQVFGLM